MKPRKKVQAVVDIVPAASGWRVHSSQNGNGGHELPTLAEVAARVPGDAEVRLALPSNAVLFERMKLPTVEPDELGDMMNLQLEKTLPFSPEEITSDFAVIEKSETESTLLAATVNNEQLGALCEPLRARGILPSHVGVFAMRAAAVCPSDQLVLLIFREPEKIVVAIVQNGKLAHVHPLDANDPQALLAELPKFLLGAEMEGIPTHFARVMLDESCADLKAAAADFFQLPVSTISLADPPPGPRLNLIPAQWRLEKRRLARRAQLRSRLLMAGAVYVIVLLGAFGWLLGISMRVKKLDAQLNAISPDIAAIGARKARWEALAPAIDPARYTVEVLFQVTKSIPSEAIHITVFDQNKDQFMIQGEAPTANAAIEFGEQLKKNPELKPYKLTVAPPTILPDERALFHIIGKL